MAFQIINANAVDNENVIKSPKIFVIFNNLGEDLNESSLSSSMVSEFKPTEQWLEELRETLCSHLSSHIHSNLVDNFFDFNQIEYFKDDETLK